MALEVIGSGFGRTGTMSTKMALQQLGFGPYRGYFSDHVGLVHERHIRRLHRPRLRDILLSSEQRGSPRYAAERLLVFNVAEGWEPLCRFLETPRPATPFPRSHPRDEFWGHFGSEPA
jgi:hypothetical protein